MYDEMSLPNGVLRVQRKGGHGHHNGLVCSLINPSPVLQYSSVYKLEAATRDTIY